MLPRKKRCTKHPSDGIREQTLAYMHTTIKDLAGATGLNISSISRSLNGQAGVSGETRKRVLQAARRLGYRRNSLAGGLITRRTRALGLILSDVRNPFSAELARGIEDAAHQAGYEVLLCNSDLDPDKELGYKSGSTISISPPYSLPLSRPSTSPSTKWARRPWRSCCEA